jgi:3-oxoacyl-(acyl-carrier-protein) synthase
MPNNHIEHITKNDQKEMDNYCFYAMEAIEGLNLKLIDKETAGVYFGSCFGGLCTTEIDLKKLYKDGLNPRAIDSRLSLKMFYASTCSQVSMKYGITGPCLLFSEGFLSGMAALCRMYDECTNNYINSGIVGASDMASPTALRACADAKILNETYVTAGAAALLLEKEAKNEMMSAMVGYGKGILHSFTYFEESMTKTLNELFNNELNISKQEVDVIIVDGKNYMAMDIAESNFFDKHFPKSKQLNFNKLIGNSFSTSALQKVVIADYLLKYPNAIIEIPLRCVKNILISSFDITGDCYFVLLTNNH